MSNHKTKRYIVEVIEQGDDDCLESLQWLNSDGAIEAPDDFPAEVSFYPSGNIEQMIWRRAGQIHRDNDQPANITLKDTPNLEVLSASWHMDGMDHREGELPSAVYFDQQDGRIRGFEFRKFGQGREDEGLPGYVWINDDGSTENEDGEPVAFDTARFCGELAQPPPVQRAPFLGLP